MLIFRICLLVLGVCAMVSAAQVEATPAVPPKAEAAKTKVEPAKGETLKGAIPDEEKWIFDPVVGRIDAFTDIEARLILENEISNTATPGTSPGPAGTAPSGKEKVDAAIEWGAKEADRVDSLILVRKWNETIQACDSAVNTLKKYESNAPVTELIERFNRYRTQAEEAKIYEEAQAKFDALGIKVEGILWSQEGSLAVIGGEPRALKINDRAKDCVIINIDTNRVDFQFHYNRRRFEFQRYVGEKLDPSRAH